MVSAKLVLISIFSYICVGEDDEEAILNDILTYLVSCFLHLNLPMFEHHILIQYKFYVFSAFVTFMILLLQLASLCYLNFQHYARMSDLYSNKKKTLAALGEMQYLQSSVK